MLMAELRAIELWDRLREKAVLSDKTDHAGDFEARRMRRREIMDEIDILLNKADRDSDRVPHTMPLSAS
jgi:hypothetical protein